MTFEEAYEELNSRNIDKVAEQMKRWHPAVLGMMLEAVHKARNMRYLSPHPDYDNVLWKLAQQRGESGRKREKIASPQLKGKEGKSD